MLAGSLALHAVVLWALALRAPDTSALVADTSPPPPYVVILMPREVRRAPLKPQRRALGAGATEPAAADRKSSAQPAGAPPPAPLTTAQPDLPSPALSGVLRAARGCLGRRDRTTDEQAACEERLGRSAADADMLSPGQGLSADKRKLLDAIALRRTTRRAEKDQAEVQRPYEAPDYDGEPYLGDGGGPLGPDRVRAPSKRSARKLPRLKP